MKKVYNIYLKQELKNLFKLSIPIVSQFIVLPKIDKIEKDQTALRTTDSFQALRVNFGTF